MLAGLVLLGSATFLLCFMQNVAMLILGRILQGMTSALTWSVGLAVAVDTVSAERMGWAMGWIGIAMSLGTLTSPLFGGIVYSKGGYYEVWAMCFALIAADIVLRILVIEKKHAEKWLQRVETTQSQLTNVTTPTINSNEEDARDSTSQNPSYPHESLDRRKKRPGYLGTKDTLGLFTSPRLLAAFWGTIAEAVLLSAFDSTLPIFVKDLFGWDSTGAGLIFLPLVLPTCLGPFVGYLCDKYGPRWLSAFGFMFYIPFLVCLRFVSENTMSDKVMLCGLLAGVGVGNAFTFGPVTAEISYAVEDRYTDRETKPIALGYALYNIAFSAGVIVGPLLGGFIRESAGFSAVGWSLAIISGATSILCALFIGGPPLWEMRKMWKNSQQQSDGGSCAS